MDQTDRRTALPDPYKIVAGRQAKPRWGSCSRVSADNTLTGGLTPTPVTAGAAQTSSSKKPIEHAGQNYNHLLRSGPYYPRLPRYILVHITPDVTRVRPGRRSNHPILLHAVFIPFFTFS